MIGRRPSPTRLIVALVHIIGNSYTQHALPVQWIRVLPSTQQDRVKHYREQARFLREQAAEMKNPRLSQHALDIADQYDRLADYIESDLDDPAED